MSLNYARCASALSSHHISSSNWSVSAFIHHSIHHFVHHFVHHFIHRFIDRFIHRYIHHFIAPLHSPLHSPLHAPLHSPLLSNAAEAAEFPARRRAGGASFRSSTNPAAFHVGRGNSDTAHMHRNSVPAVERSQDSPRDVHRPRDMARQSMPAMRNLMSRSRSRDRHAASAADEEQVRSH